MTTRAAKRTRAAVAFALAAALLAACGGGAGSVTPGNNGSGGSGSHSKTTQISMKFTVPGKNSQTAKVRRRMGAGGISNATQGLGISVVATGGTFPALTTPQLAVDVAVSHAGQNVSCTAAAADGSYSCTVLIAAPVGYDDFQITAWNAAPSTEGYGGTFTGDSPLAISTLPDQLVQLDQTNLFGFIFNGIVQSADVIALPSSLVSGAATGSSVNPNTPFVGVVAKDASGNIIIGTEPYADSNGNAVTFTVTANPVAASGFPTDVGTTQFGCPGTCSSSATYTNPNTNGYITYNGAPLSSSALTLTANVGAAITASNLVSSAITFTQSPGGINFPGTPVVTEYAPATASASGYQSLTLGPDGNIWYTEDSADKIAVTTVGGTTSEITTSASPEIISAGGDGDVYYVDNTNTLNRINLQNGNSITPIATLADPAAEMAVGGDGNLYVTDLSSGKVYQFVPGNPVVGNTCTTTGGGQPNYVAAGGGQVFFTENVATTTIGEYQTGGTCAAFTPAAATGSDFSGITLGPDGNMWFVEEAGTTNGSIVAHFNPASPGTITECPPSMLNGNYFQIASGPDGDLYLSSYPNPTAEFARVSTSCKATEFSYGLTAGSGPWKMVVGPSPVSPYTANAALWFVENSNGGEIGSIQP